MKRLFVNFKRHSLLVKIIGPFFIKLFLRRPIRMAIPMKFRLLRVIGGNQTISGISLLRVSIMMN